VIAMRAPIWTCLLAFGIQAAPASAQVLPPSSTVQHADDDVPSTNGSSDTHVNEPEVRATAARDMGGEQAFSFAWLSVPREISRSWSASRDTPVMDLAVLPRPVHRVGGDLALLTLSFRNWTVRSGVAAFLELEFDGETDRFHSGPWPGASSGQMLWRGSYEFFAAVTPRELGTLLCPSCRVELTLGYRHESQHYTGSNHGGEGTDASDQPYVGDGFVFDIAASRRAGAWYLAQRLLATGYLPDVSSYSAGFGADLHARWMPWVHAHPFVSAYGEYRFGDELVGRDYPDAYRVRSLVGLALPSSLGDVMLYLSGDIGHRYGLRILTEEATLGFGIRLALGTTTEARQ